MLRLSGYLSSNGFIYVWGAVFTAASFLASEPLKDYGYELAALAFVPPLLWALAVLVEMPAIRRIIMKSEDIYYKNCDFEFRVQEDGSFVGRFCYHVVNNGDIPIDELPSEGWIWFKSPDKAQIKYRIIRAEAGTKLRKMSQLNHSFAKMIINMVSAEPYELRFKHRIEPPLEKGEELEYEIIVRTSESETDAFTPEGSFCGFPAIFQIEKVRLTMTAPSGYEIEFTKPIVVWDASRIHNQPDKEQDAPKPYLNKSKTILTWELADVGPHDRYWSGYRFVTEKFDAA